MNARGVVVSKLLTDSGFAELADVLVASEGKARKELVGIREGEWNAVEFSACVSEETALRLLVTCRESLEFLDLTSIAALAVQNLFQKGVEKCVAAVEKCLEAEELGRLAITAEELSALGGVTIVELEDREAKFRAGVAGEEGALRADLHTTLAKEYQSVCDAVAKRMGALCAAWVAEEKAARAVLQEAAKNERKSLRSVFKKEMSKVVQRSSEVKALVMNEGLARRGITAEEMGDRELWKREEADEVALVQSSAVQKERGESPAPSHSEEDNDLRTDAARVLSAEEATVALQRVGRGAMLRQKLRRRLVNRRREAIRQGLTRVTTEEFAQRRNLVVQEYEKFLELCDKLSLETPVRCGGDAELRQIQELEQEEENTRNRIINDYYFYCDAIERAEHKQFLKNSSAFYQYDGSQPSEDDEETGALLVSSLPAGDATLADTVPVSSSSLQRYKGYELDSLGRFLLNYQADLNRMKESLAAHRSEVAFQHDQLKDARDQAAQEIVRGGTGAMWVPARPLPLADLVRGPSAQYDTKKGSGK